MFDSLRSYDWKVWWRRSLLGAMSLVALTVVIALGATGASAQGSESDAVKRDRAVLKALYEATGGENWKRRNNWLTDAPLGQWAGVRTASSSGPVDAWGRVSSLTLSRFGLDGELPAELGQLTELRNLELYDNNLSGSIPPELGNLPRLVGIYLQDNVLTGAIPPELGNLPELEFLVLRDNMLTGEIPVELASLSKLKSLSLSENDLSGEFPVELGQIAGLGLRLSGNPNLVGCVPRSIKVEGRIDLRTCLSPGEESDRAVLVSLYNATRGWARWQDKENWLGKPALGEWSGVVTNSDGRVTGLRLGDNGLSGQLPVDLGNLPYLQELELADNRLRGSIPSALGNLDSLLELELAGNSGLTGCIPYALRAVESDEHGLRLCSADRLALETLYEATGGPNWRNRENWLGDQPLGEWHGVTADDQGRVVKLRLVYNELSGELPAALGSLSHLDELHLFRNDLGGAIPAELGQLANLQYLYLSHNDFSGEIPSELGNLANLEGLAIGGNGFPGDPVTHISGVIPPELGQLTNLKGLFLGNNRLTGAVPAELGRLANLERLELSYNELTGEIPAELGGLANLRSLVIYGNPGITGCVPDGLRDIEVIRDGLPYCAVRTPRPHEPDWAPLVALYDAAGGANWRDRRNWLSSAPIGDWHGVETDASGRVVSLWLEDNQLRGEIPAALGKLSQLEYLYLAENDLTGGIPAELGRLTNLVQLWAGDNRLSGAIPAELGNLTNLQNLELYGNELSGELPPELGQLSNLQLLSLGGNDLSGELPAELGQLTSLRSLALVDNAFSGEIPAELGQISGLWILYLSGNDLSGVLPLELGNLTSLWRLHLAGNDGLTGCIPRSLGGKSHRDLQMDEHGLRYCS